MLESAERAAENRHRAAEAEHERIVREGAARADAIVEERRARLAELSDDVLSRTEELLAWVDDAARVRARFVALSRALADVAQSVAREASRSIAAGPGLGLPSPGPLSPPLAPDAPNQRAGAETKQVVAPGADPEPDGGAASGPVESTPPPADRAGVVRIPRVGRPAPVPAPVEETRSAPEQEPDPEADRFDGARLVALQMAVAGSTRSEVEHHLRRSFGLADPAGILDDVYGKGAPEDKRLSRSGPRRHAG
ncbi:MAG TPA: hypothetical protein VNT32_06880 [Thermoleophilaceae bacterium]|nr:hypothetical protein [Thermoleophilaceae bacterium]